MKRQLDQYAALLADSHGLLSKTDVLRVDEHIADALVGLATVQAGPHQSIVDVGTGGGLPGIPLALALPEARVTLLESQRKKTDFLSRAVHELDLAARVQVVTDRAEDAVRSVGRESHDIAVARALAAPAIVAEWLAPYVRVEGRMIFWTTTAAAETPGLDRVADALGFAPPVSVAAASALRETGVLLVWTKQKRTIPRFPRRAGDARRAPLGS